MNIFLLTFISIVHLAISQNECHPTRCGHSGPVVQFPFRLKDHQPERCGYPGFELSCTESGSTEFDLQFPITASTNNIALPLKTTVSVSDIDYKSQKMLASNALARSCLPEKVTDLNSSASLFEVEALGYSQGFTLFNCSNIKDRGVKVTCLSSRNYQVVAFASIYEITALPPFSSCFKMYNISYVPDNLFTGRDDKYGARFYLSWRKPSCGNCEEKGMYCRLKNSATADETECITREQGASRNYKVLIAGITSGTILVLSVIIASFFIFRSMIREENNQKLIEKILENHKDIRPRRYSYADTKTSTDNFKEKLSQQSHGTLHKGMLVDETSVVVKMLNGLEQNTEDFISQVERIGRMQHENILQLIGYCADEYKKGLIYEFLPSGTLEKFISSENQLGHILGWQKLHQIAVGIAKGIEYVHQECILGLDINPQNILLDNNFNPKVLVCSIAAAAKGAIEHIAPELLSSAFISQKADVYSFGMLLLDIIGRSRTFHGGVKKSSEVYYPEWIHNQFENREERAVQIEEEEEAGSERVKKLSIVGLWCIQWFPSDRPSMKSVIQMTEGDSIPVMPPNPFASSNL